MVVDFLNLLDYFVDFRCHFWVLVTCQIWTVFGKIAPNLDCVNNGQLIFDIEVLFIF